MEQALLDGARALNTPADKAAGSTSNLQQQMRSLASLPPEQQRAAVRSRDSSGRSALHHASEAGAASVVEALLKAANGGAAAAASASSVAAASSSAATPASSESSFSAHQLAGAQDGQGQTALHLALKAAADQRKSDHATSSSADREGHLRCAHLLLDVEEARQKLPSSAASAESDADGPAAKRARIDEDGAAAASSSSDGAAAASPSLLSIRDSFLRLPLHWAVTSGSDSILLRCLSLGSAAAATSPASFASSGSSSISSSSIISSSWVSSATRSGDTALHWACADGRLSAVDLLLSGGADPSLRNARGETPGDLCTNDQAICGAIDAWKQKHDAANAAAAAANAASSSAAGAASSVSTSTLSASRTGSTGGVSGSAGKKKIAIKLKK